MRKGVRKLEKELCEGFANLKLLKHAAEKLRMPRCTNIAIFEQKKLQNWYSAAAKLPGDPFFSFSLPLKKMFSIQNYILLATIYD